MRGLLLHPDYGPTNSISFTNDSSGLLQRQRPLIHLTLIHRDEQPPWLSSSCMRRGVLVEGGGISENRQVSNKQQSLWSLRPPRRLPFWLLQSCRILRLISGVT